MILGAELQALARREIAAGPGETITYTLSVTNRGPDAATDVTVKDPIQDTSLGTIVSLPPGCTLASGTVTCDLRPRDHGAG